MKNEILHKYKYIYHRGYYDNKEIPENSLLAFEKAIKLNMPIEFDLRLLKDNTIIVFHDDNLKRLTGIDKKISKCTYDEIKNLKLLDTNQYIMTFKELLDYVDGRVPLDIEIKHNLFSFKIEKEVSKILDKYKGDFIIKSFMPTTVLYYKLFRKDYIRGQLINYFIKNCKINQRVFNFITKPDFLMFHKKIKNIKPYKNNPIFVFTIKNDKEYILYKDIYDGFVIENITIN